MNQGQRPKRVLFVCMGNICRSPTAEGVFINALEEAGLASNVLTDSAGTHAYHVNEPPDSRSQKAAKKRGVDLSAQRARRVEDTDFEEFDYIVAMDRDNLANLKARCPEQRQQRLHLFLDFTTEHNGQDVPDPYYGGRRGFERVLDLVETASAGLIEHLQSDARAR
ncbi:MAG: low molecular weight protein-tyrosine-phosphatase [Gammaproteobacteria bacterium]